jgi:ubiquinone/menaquinone biosynthesis C-methylase UbiE
MKPVSDPVAETIRRYDEFAEEYADRWLDPAAMAYQYGFFNGNLSGPRILDAGCGPGRDAKFLTEARYEVTGIDLSTAFLDIAQSLVPRARFVQMDMRRLAFADRTFHGVWACASLQHIPHDQGLSTMKELARVLLPGGSLYVGVKEGEGQGFDQRGIFYTYYHLEEMGRLAEVSGLEVLRLKEIPSHTGHAVFIDLFARRVG